MLFSDLGLSEKLLEAIKAAGYVEPTPIQEQAIPFVLQGRDVLGCAQTGTGKTASFTLPMIEMLSTGRARARMPRSLILEPTRELAAQVQDNFEKYGAWHNFTTALIIGGESMGNQTAKLQRGVDVLIATPGRLIDQFERGNILMTDIKFLVIDECDRMLDMGFIPDIEKIAARLPRTRQTLLFSATLPPEIRRLADKFLKNPQEVTVAPPASTAINVEQAMVMVETGDKREALQALLRMEDVKNAFIFCNRKRDIDVLQRALKKNGFNAAALHGDMVQSARSETLDRFKKGELTLMVCSDVAARGIDVAGVSHVFNFDVPHHAEDYVHRIGRTGRAGNTGKAFMLATPMDEKQIAAIAALIGKPIPIVSLPGTSTIPAPASHDDEHADTAMPAPRERPRREAHAEPRRRDERRGPRARDPRPDRNESSSRSPRGQRSGEDPRLSQERNRFGRDRYQQEDDDDLPNESVLGFGPQIPAFFRIVTPQLVIAEDDR
jgi:superfamily II DNA/RNA helicase